MIPFQVKGTIMRYRLPTGEPVEWKPGKFDVCILKATGADYRQQKGSGRSTVLALAKDGMTLGDLGKEAAKLGFTNDFATDCAFKQHNTKGGAWRVEPPEGMTMDQVKAAKVERVLTEEQKAAKDAKEKAAAAVKAARELAAKQKKEAKAAEDAAKAAAKAAAASGSTSADPSAKPKGKGKAPKTAAGATPEQQAEAQANV